MIKANLDLDKVRDIINQHNAKGIELHIDFVICNPDEEPLYQMMLSRHSRQVQVNTIIPKGKLWTEVIPEVFMPAYIENE